MQPEIAFLQEEAVKYFGCGIFEAALEDSQRQDRLHDQETPITQSLLAFASQVLNNNVRHIKTLGVAKCKLFVFKPTTQLLLSVKEFINL